MKMDKPEQMILVLMILVVAACAKISAPSGGLRDKLPPVVVKSVPENISKNFTGRDISITFNEYVVLDNINDKFMISPPTQKKPRVFVRGKGVNIEFDERLRDSTTYTLYFLDAIRDLNEGNVFDNYQFVFSTGSVLDSLSVTGNVYNSIDLEVPEKVTVLLHSNSQDSAAIRDLPDYLSRVDQNGYFRIDNIREGTYRLYGLKDEDNSKNYNRVEEDFAFMDSVITITPEKNFIPIVPDTASLLKDAKKPAPAVKGAQIPVAPPALKGTHKLFMFKGPRKSYYLTGSSRELKYQLVYTFSLPPDTLAVDFSIPEVTSDSYIIENSRYRDTMTVWLTDSSLYSQAVISTILRYPFTDTLGIHGYKQDTLPMRFLAPRVTRAARKIIPKLAVQNNISGGTLKPGQKIAFRAQTPLREPDTSKIRLYELIEKERQKVPFRFQKEASDPRRYILDAELAEGKQFLIIADSAAFINIFDEYNDSTGMRFSVRKTDSYGKMTVIISNCNTNCIIQVLTNTEKLVAEKTISKDGKLEFPLLEKGTYRLKVIYDLNGDGMWTTGDFMTGRQPEPVSYRAEEIEIKEGWEVDQNWDVSEKNFKEQKLRQKPKTR